MLDAPTTPELAELEARPAARQRPLLGYAMVVSAASLWAANGVLSKVILQSGLSSFRLSEVRALGGAILFTALVLIVKPRALRFRRHEVPWLVAFGLCLAFVQFFYFVAIERLEIGVALVLQYLSPVWVALWARFYVREPVRRRLWLALALALAGLSLVVELWGGGTGLDGGGVAACLVASLAYAGWILLADRSLERGRETLSLPAIGFIVTLVFWTFAQPWWSFPAGVLDDDVSLLGRIDQISVPFPVLLALVLVLGTFVPFLLIFGALRHLSPTRVTVIAMLEPVVAAIVAYAWLGEELAGGQIAGCLLVLLGVGLAQTARATRAPG